MNLWYIVCNGHKKNVAGNFFSFNFMHFSTVFGEVCGTHSYTHTHVHQARTTRSQRNSYVLASINGPFIVNCKALVVRGFP